VVYQAHKNPRFVEDSVRIMAKVTVEKFKNAPDNILVIFRQENEESIHQHNVIAERVATMGELRHEIGN
ncbi:MAG TPA: GTP cyclohydrolase I FolE2, partial [Archaeoglobus veneficus]|nr:GTP cyclohydrolase I FolE2 [Archaeoglobus veneficus]